MYKIWLFEIPVLNLIAIAIPTLLFLLPSVHSSKISLHQRGLIADSIAKWCYAMLTVSIL